MNPRPVRPRLTLRRFLVISAAACCIAVAGLALIAYVMLESAFGVRRDIGQYPKLRSQLGGSLFAHFPDRLDKPQSARLYFDPGAWQAPTVWEVLVRVSPEEAQRVLDEFTPRLVPVPDEQAEWFPESQLTHISLGPQGARDERRGFVVIPLHCPESKDWNHPDFAGIAVNVTTGEVLYWAEAG